MNEVPVWRLNLLRAFYLLITVGLAATWVPGLLEHTDEWAQRWGVLGSLMIAVSVCAVLGLRYPLQMLPLLIWELTWKTLWIVVIALPLWLNDALTPGVEANFFACLMGVVLTPLVLPWRHIIDHYLRKPAERWR